MVMLPRATPSLSSAYLAGYVRVFTNLHPAGFGSTTGWRRAHSTWSVAISMAVVRGLSVEDICEVASWSSPSPFVRYRLDITWGSIGHCVGVRDPAPNSSHSVAIWLATLSCSFVTLLFAQPIPPVTHCFPASCRNTEIAGIYLLWLCLFLICFCHVVWFYVRPFRWTFSLSLPIFHSQCLHILQFLCISKKLELLLCRIW